MVGEMFIMGNRIIILAFWFCAIAGCSAQKNSLEGVYISIDSNAVHSDSLILYKDKSFKLNYNGYGHPLPDVIFGNWVQCGNRLFLIPENFVRKIVDEKDTSLNDSIAISIYDSELKRHRSYAAYTCYSGGKAVEMSHEATSKNNFNYNIILHYKNCDSIRVRADDFLNNMEQEYRPIIIPKANTRYTVYSRYTGAGFFLERNFYFKKGGKIIYTKWDKGLYEKWKDESDGKVSKGYLWLEKKNRLSSR